MLVNTELITLIDMFHEKIFMSEDSMKTTCI